MDMLTLLVFEALALTVGSLVSGIASMVSDGEVGTPARYLAPIATATSWPLLLPGCLAEPDVLAAMDERAIAMIAPLQAYVG